MTQLRRRHLLVAGGLAAALLLGGCAAGQISQTADQVAAIDGANGSAGKIGVRNVLFPTAPALTGYAAGADVPLILQISNDGITADTLTQVSSPSATSGAISGTATVPAQSLITLGTDSTVKLTLKSLTATLPYGHSIPVTFTFTTAGQITVNVPIAIPDVRDSNRPTIDIQPAQPTPLWLTGASDH